MYSSSVILNILGMQWYRIFFFYLRRVARIPKTIPVQYKGYLDALERDGILVIPNFFLDQDYIQLQKEYNNLKPHLKRDDAEIPIPHVDSLSIHDEKVSPFFRGLFLNNPLLKSLPPTFLNRKCNLPLNARATRIYCNQDEVNLPANGGTNNLHFDAPLRVLKAFYYISDTDEKNAALHYCLGTQKRSSFKRLLFEYKLSVRYTLNRWNLDAQGEYLVDEPWVRINPEEMHKHNIKESVMSVKGNTLIFVNTGGFHRRGRFLEPGERQTVEINFRAIESPLNAFYPLKKKLRPLLSNFV